MEPQKGGKGARFFLFLRSVYQSPDTEIEQEIGTGESCSN
jgi:hypothetical protein